MDAEAISSRARALWKMLERKEQALVALAYFEDDEHFHARIDGREYRVIESAEGYKLEEL